MRNNTPFIISPVSKDYLWGGSRLNDDYNKGINSFPLAETWECSTHPDGQCTVCGVPLKKILLDSPELLGTHPLQIMGGKPELPIIIKLLDANKDLSIQVHPDDMYASLYENGSLGKTEMWYILDAKPGSEVVYGFNRDVSPSEIKDAVTNNTICELLNHVPVNRNEVYFIEAGIVHAIGAGCLIAEIQESSNLTYRIYDYERVDKNGNKRGLHLEKAMEVINFKASNMPRQPMRVLKYSSGCAIELLARCKYFQVERILLNTEIVRQLVSYQTGENSFHVLLCVNGCGSISREKFMLNFFKGDCIFFPANSSGFKLHGRAQLLDISC